MIDLQINTAATFAGIGIGIFAIMFGMAVMMMASKWRPSQCSRCQSIHAFVKNGEKVKP